MHVMVWSALQALGALAQHAARPPLHIAAVGDLNLGRWVAHQRLLRGDTLYPFRPLLDSLRAADVLFGNLESPIAPPGHLVEDTGSMVFTAPSLATVALATAGFDVVSTANNHAWDAGRAGVLATVAELDRARVRHAGTGATVAAARAPAFLWVHGWRVAVFAATRSFNPARDLAGHPAAAHVAWADSGWLYPAIRAIKARGGADLVVVSVHAGQEFAAQPDRATMALLRGAIDAGADLCLGHHPHVLQPVEWYHGRPIVYSLGNFVFRQDAPWAGLSAIFAFTASRDGMMRLELRPVRAGFQPVLLAGAAADSVRHRLAPPGALAASTIPDHP